MKKIYIILPFIILMLSITVNAEADFSEINGIIGETELGTPEEITESILNNTFNADGQSIIKSIAEIFFGGLKLSLPCAVSVFGATVLLSVSENSLSLGKMSEIALLGGRVICGVILLSAVYPLVKTVKESLNTTDKFVTAVMPLLCTFMASSGAQSAVSILAPSSAFISAVLINAVTSAIFPLYIGGMTVSVADSIIGEGKLKGVSSLMKSCGIWLSGGLFTVFSGIITLQGLTAKVSDGISMRSVKYAVSSSVPIIGGSVSESVTAIISSACAMKEATGIMGIITVASVLLVPTVNVFAFFAVIKILTAVITPFAGIKNVSMIETVGEYVKLIGITSLGVGVVYFIFLGATVLSGGAV